MSISIRRLGEDDWMVYKAIRLEALQLESICFGSQYSVENTRTEEEWRSRLKSDSNWTYWGLYDSDECIGLTGVVKHQGDSTVADLIASYIRKHYRGRGLSALFYQTRIEWARAEGYKHLEVSHRKGNIASKAANQKFGFKYSYTENKVWADGTYYDLIGYRLEL